MAHRIIFVESFQEGAVKSAVSGITDLYGFKPGAITVVKIADMPGCVTVPESNPAPPVGSYVRLRTGMFKGDVAKVRCVLAVATFVVTR